MNNNDYAISPYGSRGWKFTIRNSAGFAGTYRTNKEGEGLFELRIDPLGNESWAQLKGTAQYSLPKDLKDAILKLNSRSREGYRLARNEELHSLKGSF